MIPSPRSQRLRGERWGHRGRKVRGCRSKHPGSARGEEAARIAGFPMMVDFGNHQPERPLYDLLKIEETIQTVMKAQELYAKAALVDHRALAVHQAGCALIDAEECLKEAFSTDVRPLIQAWRRAKGLTENPLGAYRASGYQDRIAKERAAKNATAGGSYA